MSKAFIKKKLSRFEKDEAEKYRLHQAEELLKKSGYVFDEKLGSWVRKTK